MTNREFLGEEFFKWATRDYEELRAFRNVVSGRRPSDAEKLQLTINKPWESFYKGILK